MDEFAMRFGMTMGELVTEYRTRFAWLAPLPHLTTLVLLYLVFRHGQTYRRAFSLYFVLNYVWLLIFVGGWFSVQLYKRMGLPALGMYGATPILLLIILYQWVQEFINPRLDLDFTQFEPWRLLIVVPILIWGVLVSPLPRSEGDKLPEELWSVPDRATLGEIQD